MPEPIKNRRSKKSVSAFSRTEQDRLKILSELGRTCNSECDGDDAQIKVAKKEGVGTVGTLIQKREPIHPGTYVGTGKVQEIADMIAELGATGIVFR